MLTRRTDRIDRPTWVSLLGLAAVATLGGLVSAWSIARLDADTEWLKRSSETVRQLQSLQSLLTDAETGERGYLLTDDASYLDPYRDAVAAIDTAYGDLLATVEEDGGDVDRVEALKPLIDEKLAELAKAIELHDNGQTEDALTLVRSDLGERLMRDFRRGSEAILAEERQILAARDAAREKTRTTGFVTAGLMTLLEIITLLAAVWMITRYLARIADARRKAELASRARGEFLANTSHEIRTPMTAILGYADILSDRLDDPDDRQLVETIRSNGKNLLQVLNDILDLSRIDAGRLTIEKSRTPLEPLAAELYSLLAVLAGRKSIGFEIEFENPVPEALCTDPVRLRQILLNLTGNAIKFTERGRVQVRFAYDKLTNELVVSVIDTGIGIDDSSLESIFEPFEQQDTSATRKHEGTGLGLAICQRLAAALGGTIDVASATGVGSTFTLRLDCGDLTDVDLVHATLNLNQADRASSPSAVGEFAGRVLVVDDRREIRFLVRRLIERAGGNVVEAENGGEALNILEKDAELGRSIDLCVLDMQMPVLDGFETARRIRRTGLDVPLIALTANSMSQDRKRCLDAGCDDYLAKPVGARDLIAKLIQWQDATPTRESETTS